MTWITPLVVTMLALVTFAPSPESRLTVTEAPDSAVGTIKCARSVGWWASKRQSSR